jgi:osmoprotectant transport system substrate-binding protein
MRSTRRFALGATLLALALLGAACGGSGGGGTTTGGSSAGGGCNLTVGVSGNFSESKIVAQMYGQALQNAGCTVDYQLDLSSRKVSDQALFSGRIDLKPEYLGSESSALDANAKVSGDAGNNAAILKKLEAKKGVNVLNFAPAIDTNVFVVTKATASKYHLSTVSDLAPLASKFIFGAPPDCATNKFCAIGLKNLYGIQFKQIQTTDFGGPITVHALKAGTIQVGELFSTSVYDPDFLVLTDDKHLEASDNIVPVIRKDADSSKIDSVLNAISAKLTTEKMLALNKQVDIAQQDPAAVAKSFLQEEGLLS